MTIYLFKNREAFLFDDGNSEVTVIPDKPGKLRVDGESHHIQTGDKMPTYARHTYARQIPARGAYVTDTGLLYTVSSLVVSADGLPFSIFAMRTVDFLNLRRLVDEMDDKLEDMQKQVRQVLAAGEYDTLGVFSPTNQKDGE